jgi:hypothetical protein
MQSHHTSCNRGAKAEKWARRRPPCLYRAACPVLFAAHRRLIASASLLRPDGVRRRFRRRGPLTVGPFDMVSVACLSAQRFRAAAAILFRPSGVSRRFWPCLLAPCAAVPLTFPKLTSRSAERAFSIAACWRSSCATTESISFTPAPFG